MSLLSPRERESIKRLKSKDPPPQTYKWHERYNRGKSPHEYKQPAFNYCYPQTKSKKEKNYILTHAPYLVEY